MNLRRNYESIPDLTPPHINKSTGVHGIHNPSWTLSVAQTVTGSALTDITNFTVSCSTASKYYFTAGISHVASETAGIFYGAGYSGSNATIEAQLIGSTFAGSVSSCALTAFATKSNVQFQTVAATGVILITGLVVTAGTTGNFTLQMCAGTAAATATIRANSVFEVVKIA